MSLGICRLILWQICPQEKLPEEGCWAQRVCEIFNLEKRCHFALCKGGTSVHLLWGVAAS